MAHISVKEAVEQLLRKTANTEEIMGKVDPDDVVTVLHTVELIKSKLQKQGNGQVMPGSQTPPLQGSGTNMGTASSQLSVGMEPGKLQQSDRGQWVAPDKGLVDRHEGVIPEDHPDRPKMAKLINILHGSGRKEEAQRLYDKHISGAKVSKLDWAMKGDIPGEVKKEPYNTSDKRTGVLIDKNDSMTGSTADGPMDGF